MQSLDHQARDVKTGTAKDEGEASATAHWSGLFLSPAETMCLQTSSRNSGDKLERQLRNSLRRKQTLQRWLHCWYRCPYPLRAGCYSSPASHLCTSLSGQGPDTPTPPERSPETRHWTPLVSETINTPRCITQKAIPKHWCLCYRAGQMSHYTMSPRPRPSVLSAHPETGHKARHGAAWLQSQHQGGWGKRIDLELNCQPSLSYICDQVSKLQGWGVSSLIEHVHKCPGSKQWNNNSFLINSNYFSGGQMFWFLTVQSQQLIHTGQTYQNHPLSYLSLSEINKTKGSYTKSASPIFPIGLQLKLVS